MIEEACANRGGENACFDRASLLRGDVPNIRGTTLAREAR